MLPNTLLPPAAFSPTPTVSAASQSLAPRVRKAEAARRVPAEAGDSSPVPPGRADSPQPHSGARPPRPRGSHLPAAGAGQAAAPGGSASAPRGRQSSPTAAGTLVHPELPTRPGQSPARRAAPLRGTRLTHRRGAGPGGSARPALPWAPAGGSGGVRGSAPGGGVRGLRGLRGAASARCRPPRPAGSAAARAWRRLVCRAPPGSRHGQAPPGPRAASRAGCGQRGGGACARVCVPANAGRCVNGVRPNSIAGPGNGMVVRSKRTCPRLHKILEYL